MLTLIKREIGDSIVFFILTVLGVFLSVSHLVYNFMKFNETIQLIGVPLTMYKIFGSFPFTFLPLIACAFGALQMYLDKSKGVSSFLATLATNRRQILAAKMITGVLWLLLMIVPFAVTDVVLLKMFPRAALPDAGFLADVFVTVFLCCLSCYIFGLMVGWYSGKLLPALSVILVTVMLFSLIAIKGISFQTNAIFVLFITAALVRTWQKFMSTAL